MPVKLDLNKIIQVDFPESQYYKEENQKKQIVLHHTVGGSANSAISWWSSTPERVATAIIVEKNGDIYQLFSTKYCWAHHLGTHAANNVELNKTSIGVEIVNWGALIEANGKWYPVKWDDIHKKEVANTKIKPITNVQLYPQGFKDYYGFEKYTDAQIESVKQLLVYWNEKYGIPLTYNDTMFDISMEALSGKPGVWSHTSFRSDKNDIHPQNEIIDMLKLL